MNKLLIQIESGFVLKRDAQTFICPCTLWKDTIQAATTPSENLFAMFVGKGSRSTSIWRNISVFILAQNHLSVRLVIVLQPLHKPGSFLRIKRCTRWKYSKSQKWKEESNEIRSARPVLWDSSPAHTKTIMKPKSKVARAACNYTDPLRAKQNVFTIKT